MKMKVVLCLLTVALAIASAKSYWVDLYQSTMVGNTELKAGQYRVEVVNDKAVLTNGKVRVESHVSLAPSDRKYNGTSVVLIDGNGEPRIQEIHLGGTSTKLVFSE